MFSQSLHSIIKSGSQQVSLKAWIRRFLPWKWAFTKQETSQRARSWLNVRPRKRSYKFQRAFITLSNSEDGVKLAVADLWLTMTGTSPPSSFLFGPLPCSKGLQRRSDKAFLGPVVVYICIWNVVGGQVFSCWLPHLPWVLSEAETKAVSFGLRFFFLLVLLTMANYKNPRLIRFNLDCSTLLIGMGGNFLPWFLILSSRQHHYLRSTVHLKLGG